MSAAAPVTPLFDVVTDGGLDAFEGLMNRVPVAPFSVAFGGESRHAADFERAEFLQRLRAGQPHPTTAQPTPHEWQRAMAAADPARALLALTISRGLSGSGNAAEQARATLPDRQVIIHDTGTLSAAQAFQVDAAMRARAAGLTLEAALERVRAVARQTELYFTVETLEYLRRGGRIGRVQATLGGLLNLRPVVTVEGGTYITAGRARSYRAAVALIAERVTARFGHGTPLRLGLLYGEARETAEELRALIASRHPLLWSGLAPVNPVLAVHTGPGAVGVAACAVDGAQGERPDL